MGKKHYTSKEVMRMSDAFELEIVKLKIKLEAVERDREQQKRAYKRGFVDGQDQKRIDMDTRYAALKVKNKALRKAVQAAFDCGMIPNSSANNGGAAKHSRQVHVADMLRAAMNQGD